MRQWVESMKGVRYEQEQERISERSLEQTDALFGTYVRQTMELADIPVLQVVEEPVFSQVRVRHPSVEKNIVSQERQPLGIVRSQTSEKCVEIVCQDRVRRWIAEQKVDTPALPCVEELVFTACRCGAGGESESEHHLSAWRWRLSWKVACRQCWQESKFESRLLECRGQEAEPEAHVYEYKVLHGRY